MESNVLPGSCVDKMQDPVSCYIKSDCSYAVNWLEIIMKMSILCMVRIMRKILVYTICVLLSLVPVNCSLLYNSLTVAYNKTLTCKGIEDDDIRPRVDSGTVSFVNVQSITVYHIPQTKTSSNFSMCFVNLHEYTEEILISNFDESIRKKISNGFIKYPVQYKFLGGSISERIMSCYQCVGTVHVLDCGESSKDGKMMDPGVRDALNKINPADYYLVATIRISNIDLPDEITDFRVAPRLYLVMYNRQGEKVFGHVYTKVYTDTRKNINVKDPEIYIPLIKQMLDDSKTDINKDLSFLLSFQDAKSPSIQDTYQDYMEKGIPTKMKTKVWENKKTEKG